MNRNDMQREWSWRKNGWIAGFSALAIVIWVFVLFLFLLAWATEALWSCL